MDVCFGHCEPDMLQSRKLPCTQCLGMARGTRSMRRTRVSMITSGPTTSGRSGYCSAEDTVRYLSIELQDALALSEDTEI